jgi:hypothetical protein
MWHIWIGFGSWKWVLNEFRLKYPANFYYGTERVLRSLRMKTGLSKVTLWKSGFDLITVLWPAEVKLLLLLLLLINFEFWCNKIVSRPVSACYTHLQVSVIASTRIHLSEHMNMVRRDSVTQHTISDNYFTPFLPRCNSRLYKTTVSAVFIPRNNKLGNVCVA